VVVKTIQHTVGVLANKIQDSNKKKWGFLWISATLRDLDQQTLG
jgi:hypothetical protein